MSRFSDPLHGIELPRLRLLITLALLPFLGLLRLWVAYLTRRLEASGVVRRRDDAEALVGPVEEADRVEEGGSGAGAVEAVDAGGLERPQLVADFHLRRQQQGIGRPYPTLNLSSFLRACATDRTQRTTAVGGGLSPQVSGAAK